MNIPPQEVNSLDDHELLKHLRPLPQPLHQLTRAELLDALKVAIANLEIQRKNGGWTTWILIAAIGSLFWAILGQFERVLIAQQVFASMVFCSTAFYLQKPISQLLELKPRRFSRDVRCVDMTMLASARMQVAAMVVQNAVITVASYYLTNQWKSAWIAVIFFGYQFVSSVFGLAASFNDYEVANSIFFRRATFSSWVSIFFSICAAAAIFCRLTAEHIDISSIRSGLLAASILQCFVWLGRTVDPSPFLPSLLQIQEDFTFGRISQDEAQRLADMTLAGCHYEEVLRRRVIPVLAAMENWKANIARNEDQMEKLERIASQAVQMNDDEQFQNIAKKQIEISNDAISGLGKSRDNYNKVQNTLLTRMMFLLLSEPSSDKQMALLLHSLQNSKKELSTKTAEIEKTYAALLKDLVMPRYRSLVGVI